jgi:hypothetical protein
MTVTAASDNKAHVHLRASAYAYFVHLTAPDESNRYSDNYFEIEPEEERTIVVKNKRGALVPETINVAWR